MKKVAVTFGRRSPSVTTRYSRFGGRFVHLHFRFGDDVDEGDVFALLEFLALAEHRHAVAVLARVVAQQVVDRADAEVLLERTRGLLAEDVVEPVGQRGHGYSTPISSASPRWSV